MNNTIGFGYMVVLGAVGYFIGRLIWGYVKDRKKQLETPDGLYEEANILFQKGKIKQGFALVNRIIKLDPAYLGAYLLRAKVNLDLGYSLESVIDDLTFVLRERPDDADTYQIRAQAYIKLEKLDEAMVDLEKAINLSPKNGRYYVTRSALYFVRGDHKAAIEDVTSGIELGAQESGYEFRATLYGIEKNYNLAIDDITKAIQINPEHGKYYFWKGVWLEAIENLDQAQVELTKAVGKGLSPKMQSSAQELLSKIKKSVDRQIE